MDMKQRFNSKFKSLVKVPLNLSSNLSSGDFKSHNFQINNLFSHNNGTKSSLADLSEPSSATIQYIQEKHLPLVTKYLKQKELREIQANPYLTNPKLEQEIINSIEQIYYSDQIDQENNEEFSSVTTKLNENQVHDQIDNFVEKKSNSLSDLFDPFEYILEKLPNTMDLGFILEEKKKLNKQLMVVTKRVSDLIQQNQSTYNNEMATVCELQTILTDAINICLSGRFRLDVARKNLTYPNLNIISTYKRREIMISILKEFYTIKTLLQTELTLNDLIMEDEDYASAIKLCLECLKIINSLNHYKCVTDLSAKFNYTIEMIEKRLDLALAKLCINFNNNQFKKIRETYNLLGKTQFLYDQLIVHYSTVINDKAFNIVNSYVELCINPNDLFASPVKKISTKERNFENVCSTLPSDCFLPCLIDLNKSMFYIMINYKKFIIAHNFDLSHTSSDTIEKVNREIDKKDFDCNFMLIKQKTSYGLNKIWQEIEGKLIVLLKNHNLSIYLFEDFISVINIVRKMISIGNEFTIIKRTEKLEETLKKITSEYFCMYHKSEMEKMKVFLETELWQLIPMKLDFSVEQLHEFYFLKNKQFSSLEINKNKACGENYFSQNLIESENQETPFDYFINYRKNESKNDEKLIVEERLDKNNPDQISTNNEIKSSVLMTNSSLNILRIVGKYMQIMTIYNQISFDVLLCIFQLFDYYLYGIYFFFAIDLETENQFCTLSSNLSNLIKRVESTLINNKLLSNDNRMKFDAPNLSKIVNLNDKDQLFGLLERAVGVESLVFLGEQLYKIFEPLLLLINPKDKVWLEQFFNQTVNVSAELREPIYMYVASRFILHEQIIQSMEKINWEVKEIMSQHNLYVDQLIQVLRLFRMKETDLIQFSSKLSQQSSQLLWNEVLKLVNFIFIEGFSTVKKCTNEGRALMQLDYQHFLCKVEQIVIIKPIPNKQLVEEYIKAFYYTEDSFEKLIRSEKKYTMRQLKSLVNCAFIDNKRGRQRLLALIDTKFASSSR